MTTTDLGETDADVLLWDRRTALYLLYNQSGALLYVGIAADPHARILAHQREADWWQEVDVTRTVTNWFPDRATAALAEASTIRKSQPRYNVDWQPRQLPQSPPARDSEAGYMHIAVTLMFEIESGTPGSGQRIASERDLRLRFGVSRWTVRQAMAILRARGLVDFVKGWGMVVRERPPLEPYYAPAGAVIQVRPPDEADVEEWGEIPDGVHMIVVIPPEDAEDDLPRVLPADRFEVHTTTG